MSAIIDTAQEKESIHFIMPGVGQPLHSWGWLL